MTEEEARESYATAMAHLDSILEEPEDFGSASFIEDAIVLKSKSGNWFIDWSTITYNLSESGLRHEAIDFEDWLHNTHLNH